MSTPVRSLCVTRGALLSGGQVNAATFRAVAAGTSGDDVGLEFVYEARATDPLALASGQVRRQLGLKLRAADGCNLVYVMWRLDPRPQLEVSTKINPGSRTHAQCGVRGYQKLSPSYESRIPALVRGGRHWMYAQIVGDDLFAWVNGELAWRGSMPQEARYIAGPAGVRSDNVAYRMITMWGTPGQTGADMPRCLVDGED